MTKSEVAQQLATIKSEDDLIDRADDLVQVWASAQVGFLAVEPILQFMEAHPAWDFGMPGSFVHFVEKFYRNGYEQELVKSIERHPTAHTIWMLNRVINGEKDLRERQKYIGVLLCAKRNKLIDASTLELVDEFLADT